MPATLETLKVLLAVFCVTELGPVIVPGAVGAAPAVRASVRWLLEPPQLLAFTLSVPLVNVLATTT